MSESSLIYRVSQLKWQHSKLGIAIISNDEIWNFRPIRWYILFGIPKIKDKELNKSVTTAERKLSVHRMHLIYLVENKPIM